MPVGRPTEEVEEKTEEGPTKHREISWGDEEDDGEILPQPTTFYEEDDQNGDKIKVVVEYLKNDEGKTVKVTRKYKQEVRRVRNNPAVAQRKKWKKFGFCANLPPGPERGVTDISQEDIPLTLGAPGSKQEELPKDTALILQSIECRICKKKGDHYTANCPLKNAVHAPQDADENKDEAKSNVYRPPNKRGIQGDDKTSEHRSERDELPTLRVSNLSESAHEQDLQELFKPFGPVQRVFIAKDKQTGESRGFGFVTYYERKDAQRALKHLDGYGYDHLILHLEWALPSKK